jgi:peptide/histidine transporter 3/4
MVSASEYLTAYVKISGGASIGTVALGFTLPLAGWLADMYLGRYKVIRWSMWIMWTASMLATGCSVVAQLVDNDNKIFQEISVVMFVIVAIGFGGYQANIIQFGLDQLQDASTTEITAFLRWYIWTYISN